MIIKSQRESTLDDTVSRLVDSCEMCPFSKFLLRSQSSNVRCHLCHEQPGSSHNVRSRGAAIGVSALWEIHFLNGAKVGPLVVVRDLVLVWCEAVNMAPQPLSQTLPVLCVKTCRRSGLFMPPLPSSHRVLRDV